MSCYLCDKPIKAKGFCVSHYKQHWASQNKERLQKKHQEYYILRADRFRAASRDCNRRLKIRVIEAYGGKCQCCGESQIEFLTIDHINGGGTADRQSERGYGSHFYRWLERNDYPIDEFQCLCYNCNCAKSFFGHCPHGKEKNG